MTDFETAARKAAEAIREMCEYYSPTSDYIPPSARILETITKHYANLAETFGLLRELARATKLFVMAHDNLETEKALNRSNYNTDIEDIAYIGKAVAGTELRDLLANPRIAALLDSFDKGAENG